MVPAILSQENAVLEAVNYFPSVSIILPFEPKMSLHRELEYLLERTVEKVEKNLLSSYSYESAKPVIEKLKSVVNKVDFTSFKRSMAILSTGFPPYILDARY